jgi:hypothetical protein
MVIPGCRKIIDWGKRSFPQAQKITYNKNIIKQYTKSFVAYDELDTAARFDVLWLSDQVRTEYARLHTYTYGKPEEFYQALLRRQLEENKHFITFYVLSVFDVTLGNTNSNWSVFLRINGMHNAPSDIKVIDPLPEYKTFLAKQLTPFRTPYRIMFDARDIEDKLLLSNETKIIELVFRSTTQEFTLSWYYVPQTNQSIETAISKNKEQKEDKENQIENNEGPVSVTEGDDVCI